MDANRLTFELKTRAAELGFALCGVCPAVSPAGVAPLTEWLAAGYAGEMAYFIDRQEAYRHPRSILEGVRSLLMLGMSYRTSQPMIAGAGEGRVAQYAWGTLDYHDVIHERLKTLSHDARRLKPDVRVRGVVDTAPLLEREFAQLAGLGWVGKNTMLLNRQHGSWFFLAALLFDCELVYDEPFRANHCGSCDACLRACPTHAFPQPYVLDATRCISYLTIELRDAIPGELRGGLGQWLFGCDICQEVCPWNRKALAGSPEFAPHPQLYPASLYEFFMLNDEQFRRLFRRTPLWRARRRGLLRNAAIVLGNQPSPHSLAALQRGLQDSEPLVRGAAAWALGQLGLPAACAALSTQLAVESDAHVQREIHAALEERREA